MREAYVIIIPYYLVFSYFFSAMIVNPVGKIAEKAVCRSVFLTISRPFKSFGCAGTMFGLLDQYL